VTAGLAVAAAAPLHDLSALTGSLGARELQGAIALAALAVLMLASGTAQLALTRRLRRARLAWVPRHPVALGLGLATVGLATVIAVGGAEGSTRQVSTGAGRFVALASNRYDFWRVALKAFAAQPLHGVGAGGWQVWWLRYRSFAGFARDAHSLPLQTAAELGIVGLVLLLVFFAGVALSGRLALRIAAPSAAGPLAGFIVYVAHAPLDWDWQMPALTLVALLLAAGLLAFSDGHLPTRTAGARRTRLRSARSPVARDPSAESPSAYHAATLSGSRATTPSRMRRAARRSP
jgi:O-antigen ligase